MSQKQTSDSLLLFLSIYIFFKKYLIIFLIFLILGAAYGIYKSKSYKPVFSKEVLIYSEDISYILIKQFTLAMKKDLSLGNHKLIADRMKLDENIVRQITDAKTDSVALKGKIYALTLFTFSDTTGTANFSQAYIGYLSSVPYIYQLMETNKQKYTKILEKIDLKLKELDAFSPDTSQNNSGLRPEYLSQSSNGYIDLYAKKLDYEDRLKNYSEIKLIRESTTPLGPQFGMTWSVVIYAMIFLVAALVVAFLLEMFAKVRKLEKSLK